MKRTMYVLIMLQTCSIMLFAQEFSTKLYFEAANGEKDTLEIGYDANATAGVDEIFGEVDYGTPPINLDKFQVFVIEDDWSRQGQPSSFYLKKQIVKKAEWQKTLSIIIPLDYFPVTVTWDNTLFNDKEREYSVFTDWSPGCWWDVACTCLGMVQDMRENNSVVLPETLLCKFDYDGFLYTLTERDATKNYFLAYVGFLTCEERHPCEIYPLCFCKTNSINNIEIDTDEIIQVSVYSVSGKKLLCFKGEEIENNNIQSLPNGVYIIVSENKNHEKNYSKLIKN